MQLIKALLALTLLSSTGLANPLEVRGGGYGEKDCGWKCDHYKPYCDQDWQPTYCSKWGKQSSCQAYCEFSLPMNSNIQR